jgi:hypothetical protein
MMKLMARSTKHPSLTRSGQAEARGLMFLAVFCAAMVAFAPQAASAEACPGTPAGFTTQCAESSCPDKYAPVNNYTDIMPVLMGMTNSCTGARICCIELGDSVCNKEALAQKRLSGSCQMSSCTGGLVKSSRSASMSSCPKDDVCCYSKDKQAAGGSCTTLGGVSSVCQDKIGTDQLDLLANTYLSKYVAPNSCRQSCVVTKGNDLCTGIAKAESISGSYVCAKQGDCADGSPLAGKVSGVGEVCSSGQICCISKSGATAAGKTIKGSSVTLPDPLAGLNFPTLVGNIIRTFAGIAGSIALLMFVWGGISYITSGGSSDQTKKAKTTLINAAIGLVLILSAYSFVTAIIDTLLAPSTTVSTTDQGTGGTIPPGQ